MPQLGVRDGLEYPSVTWQRLGVCCFLGDQENTGFQADIFRVIIQKRT